MWKHRFESRFNYFHGESKLIQIYRFLADFVTHVHTILDYVAYVSITLLEWCVLVHGGEGFVEKVRSLCHH